MILSWTDELMRAYDILNSTNDRNLLPLCHSTQNAQITIDINSDGTIPSIGFAEKVEKEDAVTIIPEQRIHRPEEQVSIRIPLQIN